MASFINANLGSDSDSDDADFDPTKEGGEVVSEEDNSGDDENPDAKSNKKQTKKKKNAKKVGRSGGIFLEDDNDAAKAENESRRKEFEQEKEDIAKEVQKQKTDDLWAGKNNELVYKVLLKGNFTKDGKFVKFDEVAHSTRFSNFTSCHALLETRRYVRLQT